VSDKQDRQGDATNRRSDGAALPQTPHELPLDRGAIDALLTRVRDDERLDLLDALLNAVDWSAFGSADGTPLSALERAELVLYFRDKFADVGPLYLAELLSTEFMTEQRARGDVVFSERLLELGRSEPELWAEIRQFFRRKEIVTGLLLLAHQPATVEPERADGDGR
jgi:hypothetical protein